jgi:hypothetical protein
MDVENIFPALEVSQRRSMDMCAAFLALLFPYRQTRLFLWPDLTVWLYALVIFSITRDGSLPPTPARTAFRIITVRGYGLHSCVATLPLSLQSPFGRDNLECLHKADLLWRSACDTSEASSSGMMEPESPMSITACVRLNSRRTSCIRLYRNRWRVLATFRCDSSTTGIRAESGLR